jgi:hypothetical protein
MLLGVAGLRLYFIWKVVLSYQPSSCDQIRKDGKSHLFSIVSFLQAGKCLKLKFLTFIGDIFCGIDCKYACKHQNYMLMIRTKGLKLSYTKHIFNNLLKADFFTSHFFTYESISFSYFDQLTFLNFRSKNKCHLPKSKTEHCHKNWDHRGSIKNDC